MALKYQPCQFCGKKPKAERVEGFGWSLDHFCKDPRGVRFMGTENGLASLIRWWNEDQRK